METRNEITDVTYNLCVPAALFVIFWFCAADVAAESKRCWNGCLWCSVWIEEVEVVGFGILCTFSLSSLPWPSFVLRRLSDGEFCILLTEDKDEVEEVADGTVLPDFKDVNEEAVSDGTVNWDDKEDRREEAGNGWVGLVKDGIPLLSLV